MGAYDNPNVNVGVDTVTGQLLGKTAANVGSTIAKGMLSAAKTKAKGVEKYNKILEANNIIDNKVDELITKETISQDASIEEKGLKGANIDSLKEAMSLELKEYGDALKRNKKNYRRKNYEGKEEDLKTIQNFEILSGELPSILENVNALFGEASEAYANGKAAGDTNAFFKAATYIGAKTLPGELTYSINKNNATGRLELGMQAKGESIKEINKKEAGYLGDVPMYGEYGEDGPPSFSDSYFINLTNAAKDYANPTNPYNSPLLSTDANINNLLLDVYNTNTNDPENTDGSNTPFSEGNTINPSYKSDPQRVYQPDPTRQGELETGEATFNLISRLNPIAQNAVDQQYHNLSTLKGGNVTLTNSIMSELKKGDVIMKDRKLYYNAFVDSDGMLITESKDLRDSNGKIKIERSLVELQIPELNKDKTGDNIFTSESEESIKRWMKSKALALAGAYDEPSLIPGTDWERYYGIEKEENKPPNQFAPIISDINSVPGTSLSSSEVVKVINKRKPDGYKALNIDQAIKYYTDNTETESAEKLEKLKENGENPVFVQKVDMSKDEDAALTRLPGTNTGRISKEQLESEITNFFKDGGEQKDFRVGSIAAKSSIKELDKDIAKYKRLIKNPTYKAMIQDNERILKELEEERESRR